MVRYDIKRDFIAACFIVLLLAGCGGKSFDYVDQKEIPPGPGVFTGEKGEWTVYDSDAKQDKAAAEPVSDNKQVEAAEGAGPKEPPAATDDADYEEFKQFQKWKKEQQDFESFKEWKKSSQGSREYREFKQWQEWKAYKEWQEGQKKSE